MVKHLYVRIEDMSNELILEYQKTGDKKLEDQLLAIHAPYIKANINKWAGSLPQPVIEAHGKNFAIQAFKTFDPSKNAQINTHLYNNISQIGRFIYQHANVSQIPEHIILQIGKINQAKDYLSDQLNRDPTNEELSDHLHMPVAHIEKIFKNQRADFINDSDKEKRQDSVGSDNRMADRIFSYRNSLTDLDKKKFDAIVGYGNTTPMKPQDFGKKFNMKPYEVSRLKTFFAKGLQ